MLRRAKQTKRQIIEQLNLRILNEQMSDDERKKLLGVVADMEKTLKEMTALYHKARRGERAGSDNRSEMMGGRGKGFEVRDIPKYEKINRSLQEVLKEMKYIMS
jgi:hypothetical protein